MKHSVFYCLVLSLLLVSNETMGQGLLKRLFNNFTSSISANNQTSKKSKTEIANSSLQKDEKIVTLVTSGTGNTKEVATRNALRSAIEQAYGTFVSANTNVVNDELVKDEIATISSGNIQKYEELSSINTTSGVEVTLKAWVSPEKLVSFAKNKGMQVELAGATFAMNLKMMQLNKENEEKTLPNLRNQLAKICEQGIFDYELKTTDPIKLDNSDYYLIQFEISVKRNQNTRQFYDHLYKTLRAYSLTEDDFTDYVNKNIPYYIYDRDMYMFSSQDHFRGEREWTGYEPDFFYKKKYSSDHFYLRTRTLTSLNIQSLLLSAIKMFQIRDNMNNMITLDKVEYKLVDGSQRFLEKVIVREEGWNGIQYMAERYPRGYIDWNYTKMRDDKGNSFHFNNILEYNSGTQFYPKITMSNPNCLYTIKLSKSYSLQELSQLSNIVIEPIYTIQNK